MELFLPGFATLLIAGLIVFLIIPRLGAPILAALSVALLAYGVYNHAQMFGYEYRYSTWQEILKRYASYILIGVLIVFILIYISFLFFTEGPEALPASNFNNSGGTGNGVKNIVNSIGETVQNATEVATEAVNNIANSLSGNNSRSNREGLLTNLSNILASPTKRINNRNKNSFF